MIIIGTTWKDFTACRYISQIDTVECVEESLLSPQGDDHVISTSDANENNYGATGQEK